MGAIARRKMRPRGVALAAYIFYLVGTYLMLYLSRTREYFADHFCGGSDGEPQRAFSRSGEDSPTALWKKRKNPKEPSRLLQGTRALGIYDAKAATSTGTAYRVAASPERIGRVFLWDLFQPLGLVD